MKDLLRITRFAFYVFALPFAATAAVSAHQYLLENQPITIPVVVDDDSNSSVVSGLTGSFRNHTLVVNETGHATGRIVKVDPNLSVTGLPGMKVLAVLNGAIAQQVYTDFQGGFEVKGLTEGVYSFVTIGNEGFATWGVKVFKGVIDATNNRMEIAVVNPDFIRVREIFYRDNVSPTSMPAANANHPSRIDGANLVSLDSGKLTGRLFNFVPWEFPENTHVHLVRNHEIVAVAPVDPQGNFSFAGVEPGVYEFVAASLGGFAAVSFEAVDETHVELPGPSVDAQGNFSIDDDEPETIQTASVMENVTVDGATSGPAVTAAAPSLDVALTNPDDQAIVLAQLENNAGQMDAFQGDYLANEVGYGTACGAGCGSGGFGGGGCGFGGLGDIAKLAILGWVLTELFDGDNNNNVPPPSSPSR